MLLIKMAWRMPVLLIFMFFHFPFFIFWRCDDTCNVSDSYTFLFSFVFCPHLVGFIVIVGHVFKDHKFYGLTSMHFVKNA